MVTIAPFRFWESYREHIRDTGSMSAYQADKTWTPIAVNAAAAVCTEYGLKVMREYFRLDISAYERRREGEWNNWDLRVAFEHENCVDPVKGWHDELCKLAHIIADLRVLVFYVRMAENDPRRMLEERIEVIGDRMGRLPDGSWLLIVGPSMPRPRDAFAAFSWDRTNGLLELDDSNSLRPRDLNS